MHSCFKVRDRFVAAGWSDQQAILGALKFNDQQATTVLALRVPEKMRAALLRHPGLDGAAVRAFQDAAEISAFCNLPDCANLPENLRDPLNYFRDGRLMTAAEAKARMVNAMADRDEHIDTARPNGPLSHSIGASASIVDRDALVRMYGEEAVKNMEAAR